MSWPEFRDALRFIALLFVGFVALAVFMAGGIAGVEYLTYWDREFRHEQEVRWNRENPKPLTKK